MMSPDGFIQGYNVQVAVDELQLIVGQAVTQETNDKKQLMPMIRSNVSAAEQRVGAFVERDCLTKRLQRTRLELSLVVISILGQFQLLGEPRPRGPFTPESEGARAHAQATFSQTIRP